VTGAPCSSARKLLDAVGYCTVPEPAALPDALPEPDRLPEPLVPELLERGADELEPEPDPLAAPEELPLLEPEVLPEVDALPPPSLELEELQPANASAPRKSGMASTFLFILSPPAVIRPSAGLFTPI